MTVTPKRLASVRSKWPFVVLLHDREGTPWTGSIIGAHHILTAAHCVVKKDGSVVQTQDTFVNVYGEQKERTGPDIERICRHPDYKYSKEDGMVDGFRNDIAIIELNDPLPRPHVKCLPLREEQGYRDGTAVTQLGFGGDIGVKNAGFRECVGNFLRYSSPDTDFYNETTLATRTKTCGGDSGGPVLIARTDVDTSSISKWAQIGVHSQGGDECAALESMGVCSRTARKEIFDWISKFAPR